MIAQIVLTDFVIGIFITILFATISAFTGLIIYIFNNKTGTLKERTDRVNREFTEKFGKLEKKMEPIPIMEEKISKIEKIDFSKFATKEDIVSITDLAKVLSHQIESLEEESDSIVREAPDKYQTKFQCQQNMNSFITLINDFRDESRTQRKEDLERRKEDRDQVSRLDAKIDRLVEKLIK